MSRNSGLRRSRIATSSLVTCFWHLTAGYNSTEMGGVITGGLLFVVEDAERERAIRAMVERQHLKKLYTVCQFDQAIPTLTGGISA
jgi:hypothetical protein